MKKTKYHLTVSFEKTDNKLLYSGVSWYRRGIEDEIIIRQSAIDIIFTRSSKVDSNYVFKPLSPVRYELYRAACFYLAVVGTLPSVKSIVLTGGKESIALDAERLTKHWNNCQIKVVLKPEIASKCFLQDGKDAYIVLTYFLKAQLDSFPFDGFRAAWSGLNALYSTLIETNSESKKLNRLKYLMTVSDMSETSAYVATLDDRFWKRLEWYNYVHNLNGKTVDDDLQRIGTKTLDKTIYTYLTDQIRERNKRDKEIDKDKLEKLISKPLNSRKDSTKEKYIFLVTEYCYMLRNRSFHAARPYPVFGLFEEENQSIQEQLTEVILHTIADLFYIF